MKIFTIEDLRRQCDYITGDVLWLRTSEQEFKDYFNRAQEYFCEKTDILKATGLIKERTGDYTYKAPDDCLRVLKVFNPKREEVEKISQKIITDAEDYKAKYGVTLVREETIGGRTYTPPDTGILDDKGYE